MPEVECILVEEPQPEGPYGAKGVGEAALVPTAAAVAGALHAFDGIRRTRLPMKDSPAALAAVPHLADRARRRRVILAGATVVTSLDPVRVVDGDVRVEDGRVAAAAARGDARRDCSGCLVVPGNVCAHTHLYSALARGMPYALEPPGDFVEILQRVWWRLDRALDEERSAPRRSSAGWRRCSPGRRRSIDHHASPNAIDGSLDVIERRARARSACARCSATRPPTATAPERAAAGIAENRALPRARAARAAAAGARRWSARTRRSRSRTRRSRRAPSRRRARRRLHVHAAEDGADERDAEAATAARRRPARAAGALDEHTLLAHGVHLDDDEIALVAPAGAIDRPQRALEHEQRRSAARRSARSAPHVALGTDGIGSDMFEESHAAYFRLREDDLGAGAGWPLAPLAEGARLAGRVLRRAAARHARAGRARRPRRPRLRGAGAAATTRASPATGSSGSRRAAVRDVMVAGEWVVLDRRLARVDERELAAAARVAGRAALAAARRDRPHHEFAPKGGGDGRHERGPRRALPAGQASDPRGHGVRAARRGSAASRPCGRPRAGSCARRPCRWRRSPP